MAANTQPQFRPGFRPQYRGGGRGGGTRRPANGPRPQGTVQNSKQDLLTPFFEPKGYFRTL